MQCCEPTAEERSAVNPHATFCGSGRRATASRDPVARRNPRPYRDLRVGKKIFTSQAWSVLPCVRPLGAVHMTAGHNALRGSGPSQQHAFEDAMALVGCPDRRIDRLCITCCSPSQPSHHAGYPARSRSPRKSDGFFVAFALGHPRPGHPRNFVRKCDGCDLRGAPRQQRREPGPMLGAMDFGVADDGEHSGHEQAAQIAVPMFTDAAEPLLAPLECCLGTSPIQAEKLRRDRKVLGSATLATKAVASIGPTPGM